jgi:hypothetical protein
MTPDAQHVPSSRVPGSIPSPSQRVKERQKEASSTSLHSRVDVMMGGSLEGVATGNGGHGAPHHRPTTSSSTDPTQYYPPHHPNSNWLLRLFESEFFDSNLAVYYLHKYPGNIGIQHYICRQLKGFQDQDLEFLLPQLCHMVVNEHTESCALEGFIYHMCATSHLGLLVSGVVAGA